MRFNLSEINELIRSRRTIYPEQFSDRKVHKEQIELLLNNAQWAPTHGNTQPWRFQVFMEEGRKKLSTFLGQTYLELTPEDQHNDAKLVKMLRRPLLSSAVIAVCMKRQEWSTPKLIYSEAMNQFLGLDVKDKCLGLFYIGYPGIEWPDNQHRRPLEYNCTWITE